MTLLLTNEDIVSLLRMEDCIQILNDAYAELAKGDAVIRPRTHAYLPSGARDHIYCLKSMEGGAKSLGIMALRISSEVVKFPSIGGIVRQQKVPTASGNKFLALIFLFSTTTGDLLAVMQDGYLQRMRVGATNGLAAQYMARANSETIGVLGSGWQAASHLKALCTVLPKVKRARVYSPQVEHRKKFALQMENDLQIEIEPVEEAYSAVKGADVVATATSSREAIFDATWLESGMHLSSVNWREIDGATFKHADVLVIHLNRGNLGNFVGGGLNVPSKFKTDWAGLPELADLVAGKISGRENQEQVTFFSNNIGSGLQFAAVGAKVLEMAMSKGYGKEIPATWFLQDINQWRE